ncbi:MAG: hypothetical protein AAGF11_38570 [Myxococcota bacterium]
MKLEFAARVALFALTPLACGGPQPYDMAGAATAGSSAASHPISGLVAPDSEPAPAEMEVECSHTDLGSEIIHHESGQLELANGQVVAFERTTTGQDGQYSTATAVTLSGDHLLAMEATVVDQAVTVAVSYGEAFSGIRHSQVEVSEGTITGHIDDRPLLTMSQDAPQAEWGFEDGGLPPDVEIDPEIAAAIDALLGADPESCTEAAASQPGHDSTPVTSLECIGCWGGCIVGAVTCIIAAVAGCAAAGPFYPICAAVGIAACAVGEVVCLAACYDEGGPCCPVGCGAVACCAENETCLNSSTGLCCSPGLDPCMGQNCCDQSEVCFESGPEAGTCCPAAQQCGDTCCGELETCHDGMCCPFNSEACADTCCGSGEVCVGGGQCCLAGQACGDQCCGADETCNAATQTCETICAPTEFLCTNNDTCCPNGTVCSVQPGVCCNPGEYFCDGQCRPLNECIS